MKKILLSLLTLIPVVSLSQLTTISPDTVCFQTSGSIYEVPNTPGYTYDWVISSPGIILGGQGTSQISVDWSNAPLGTITNGVSVSATNSDGCTSPSINLDVFIFQITPTITSISPLCSNEPCVPLVGTPIGGVFSGPGVTGNQFCPSDGNLGSNTITYTITQGGCTFTITTTVIVNPQPILSPIQHN
jgi:hypothetical protein